LSAPKSTWNASCIPSSENRATQTAGDQRREGRPSRCPFPEYSNQKCGRDRRRDIGLYALQILVGFVTQILDQRHPEHADRYDDPVAIRPINARRFSLAFGLVLRKISIVMRVEQGLSAELMADIRAASSAATGRKRGAKIDETAHARPVIVRTMAPEEYEGLEQAGVDDRFQTAGQV
jgi:hypothetical protein